MTLDRSIAILGGDSRQISLAHRLLSEGMKINVYGLPQKGLLPDISYFEDWREAIKDTGAILLPLPASSDSKRVYLPLFDTLEGPLLKELFQCVRGDALIAGGKFSPAILSPFSLVAS